MHPFEYSQATEERAATGSGAVAGGAPGALQNPDRFLAGGTTLIDLMQLNVETPSRLVDVSRLPLAKIEPTADGRPADRRPGHEHRSGARPNGAPRTTRHCRRRSCRARPPSSATWRRPAATFCSGLAAITSGTRPRPATSANRDRAARPSRATTASTPSWARATSASPPTRRICVWPMAAFGRHHRDGRPAGGAAHPLHRLPPDARRPPGARERAAAGRDHHGRRDCPPLPFAARSHYLKVRDRASYAFALTSAAVALDLDGGTVREARIALGGVGDQALAGPGRRKGAGGQARHTG